MSDPFWRQPFSVTIRNDSYNIKGYFELSNWQSGCAYIKSYFQEINRAKFYCWDAYSDESYVYAAVATNYYIAFLSVSNIFGFHSQKNLFSYYYDHEMKTKPSLCFHNCSEKKVVSLINENSMKIFSLGRRLSVNHIDYPLCHIYKHEYIGGGIYLLLSCTQLYFAEVKDNILKCYKQLVKDADGVECNIADFAVNHWYKTDSGRARFFIAVAGNKMFLFDLLERYNKNILPIQLLSNTVARTIDSISFVRDNIFLVQGVRDGPNPVIHTELNSDWALKKMFANQRFSEPPLTHQENNARKKNNYWKKLYAFFYEQKFSILSWAAGALFIYYCLNRVQKKRKIASVLFLAPMTLGPMIIPFIFSTCSLYIGLFTGGGLISPQSRQKICFPFFLFLKLLPLKIRNYVRYGIWS